MSRAGAASRLAKAAAVGGGGLGALGAGLYGVLRVEARLARMRIGPALDEPPDPTGTFGARADADHAPIWLAVLGDSAAAGYGASTPADTFGSFVADGLAVLTGRPVHLVARAVVGAQSADLLAQVESVFAGADPPPAGQPVSTPDVVAIIIGANDVTHRVRPSRSVQYLRAAVAEARRRGAQVVVGTCPDLGTVRPLAPPLRQVARRWSRRLAAAQTIAVVEAGGRSVSLGAMLGPDFYREPGAMFGPDRFHPSPAGYRAVATAMLPSVADVLGLLPQYGLEPEPFRDHAVFALARAAAVAAELEGTEVSAPSGSSRLARLRRRSFTLPGIGRRAQSAHSAVEDVSLDGKRPERLVSEAPIGQALGTEAPSTRR